MANGATELPITDPRMTRFWITLAQGVDFVLSTLGDHAGRRNFRAQDSVDPRSPTWSRAIAPGRHKIVGIRPGEKLHEIMSPADDARSTAELGDRYAIEPAFVEYPRAPFRLDGGPGGVPEDFSYASDTNPDWLSAAALMAMVEEKAAA